MSTDKWCFKQTANLLSLGTRVCRHVVRLSFARSSELVRGIVAKLTRVILHPDTRVWVKYHAKFGFMILPSITMEVAFQLYSFHWGRIVELWEKAQKNAENSQHSITIGSSILGKRGKFKLLDDGALARS